MRFDSVKGQILLYGAVGGILVAALQLSEFRFLVIEHSFQIYGSLIALTFAVLGIWLGRRLAHERRPEATVESRNEPAPVSVAVADGPFAPDEKKRETLGITRRELEVLGLIARGLSNREIAGELFVSENTVKTHSSRVFEKLGAKRRTQAVQLGKELGLLP